MRKERDGGENEMKNEKNEKKKIMAFLVATTSLPAVYRPNGYARTTTAGKPHARAKIPNLTADLRKCVVSSLVFVMFSKIS